MLERVHYDGKDGTLKVQCGIFGYWAEFTADEIESPGVRIATFGNGHDTEKDALAAAVRGGVQEIAE